MKHFRGHLEAKHHLILLGGREKKKKGQFGNALSSKGKTARRTLITVGNLPPPPQKKPQRRGTMNGASLGREERREG